MGSKCCPCCGVSILTESPDFIGQSKCKHCRWIYNNDEQSNANPITLETARRLFDRFGRHGVQVVLETPGVTDRIAEAALSSDCPVCGKYVKTSDDPICDLCYWERSVYSELTPHVPTPPNARVSLSDARMIYQRHGAAVSRIVHGGLITPTKALAESTDEIEIPNDWMS